jgi:hypothetical protein
MNVHQYVTIIRQRLRPSIISVWWVHGSSGIHEEVIALQSYAPLFLVPPKQQPSTCIVGMYIESQLHRGEETVSSSVVEY